MLGCRPISFTSNPADSRSCTICVSHESDNGGFIRIAHVAILLDRRVVPGIELSRIVSSLPEYGIHRNANTYVEKSVRKLRLRELSRLTSASHEASCVDDVASSRLQDALRALKDTLWFAFAPMQGRVGEYSIKAGLQLLGKPLRMLHVLCVRHESMGDTVFARLLNLRAIVNDRDFVSKWCIATYHARTEVNTNGLASWSDSLSDLHGEVTATTSEVVNFFSWLRVE